MAEELDWTDRFGAPSPRLPNLATKLLAHRPIAPSALHHHRPLLLPSPLGIRLFRASVGGSRLTPCCSSHDSIQPQQCLPRWRSYSGHARPSLVLPALTLLIPCVRVLQQPILVALSLIGPCKLRQSRMLTLSLDRLLRYPRHCLPVLVRPGMRRLRLLRRCRRPSVLLQTSRSPASPQALSRPGNSSYDALGAATVVPQKRSIAGPICARNAASTRRLVLRFFGAARLHCGRARARRYCFAGQLIRNRRVHSRLAAAANLTVESYGNSPRLRDDRPCRSHVAIGLLPSRRHPAAGQYSLGN